MKPTAQTAAEQEKPMSNGAFDQAPVYMMMLEKHGINCMWAQLNELLGYDVRGTE